MRKILDLLYLVSGAIAATCLFLIAVTIVAQVIGRIVGVTIDSTESGGFFLAGTTFMGMAWTLKTGGHVRVQSRLVDQLLRRRITHSHVPLFVFSRFTPS